jgi:predicted GNAT family acetyltransferase
MKSYRPLFRERKKSTEELIQFINEFASKFEKAYFMRGMGLVIGLDEYNTAMSLDIKPFDGRIHIGSVLIPEEHRGKGLASNLMKKLIQFADLKNVELDLEVQPFGKKGLNKTQLRDWYKGLGFKQKGNNRDTLVYIPNPPIKLTGKFKK